MNINDISNKTGFSIATVSRVINNKGNVSEKTTKKILKEIEESGYTPNVFARALGHNSIKTIGLMCSDASDLYLAAAVTILERELRKYGYDSILCNTGYELDDKKKYLSLLLDKRVDAVILVGSQFKEQSANTHIAAAAARVPVMLINAYIEIDNVYCAVCAERDITRLATEMCIKSGHTNILFCIDKESYSNTEKFEGYKSALHSAGIPLREEFTAFFPRDILRVEEEMAAVLEREPKITCAICSDDLIAVGVVKAVLSKGLSVPEEFSVIGSNNSLLALCTTPLLTSIDNKVEELCKNSVEALIGVFEGREIQRLNVICAEIIERGSTCFTNEYLP